MSILKGNINLKAVNVKPDEANKLIDGLMLPVSLKAGMIGNLQIKVMIFQFCLIAYQFSLLSVWTSPIELIIDDLFLILGPNLSFLSHDESYIVDEELDESYDSTNVFNIFEHELQIKKKPKSISNTSLLYNLDIDKTELKKDLPDEEDSLKNNFHNLMKNLKLTIRRLHIRFEDDYFSMANPFSFGIVIDKVELSTSDTEWTFDSLLQLNFFRVKPQHQDQENSGQGLIILKELNLTEARFYINSMSEMFIPTSLWEQTRHLENQIFDAMPVESLNDLMVEAFTNKNSVFNVISNFSLFGNIYSYKQNAPPAGQNKGPKPFGQMKVKFLFTSFDFNLTPTIIDDLSRFYEFMQNFSISLDLKQYRPQRKPFSLNDMNVQDIQDDSIKRKRRLIVRDWFFFVVWYVRLRRLLVDYYSEAIIEKEIEDHKEKYEGLFKAAESGKDNIKTYLNEQNSKISQQPKQADDNQRKYDDIQNLYKFQGIRIRIFEDYDKLKTKDNQNLPSFELDFDTLVYESNTNFISNKETKSTLFKDLRISHSQIYKKDYKINIPVSQQYQSSTNPSDNMKCLTQRDTVNRNGPIMNRGLNNKSIMNLSSINQGSLQKLQSSSSSNFQGRQQRGYDEDSYQNHSQQSNTSYNISQSKTQRPYNNQQSSNLQSQDIIGRGNTRNNPQSTGNTANNNVTNNQSNSILDNIFGLKTTFGNFFANFTNSGTSNPPQDNSNNQQSQQQQRAQQYASIDRTFNQFESRDNNRQTTRLNNTQNMYNEGSNSKQQQDFKSPLKGRSQYGANITSSNYQRRGINLDTDLNQILGLAPTSSVLQNNKARITSQSNFNNSQHKYGQQAIQAQVHNQPQQSLLNQYSKWQPETYEHKQHSSLNILKTQFCQFTSNTQQPAFTITKTTNIVNQQSNTAIRQQNQQKNMNFDIQVGNIDFQYCNDIIKNMCETIVSYKQLHVFRYVPLKNLIQKRENIQRKIELHAPLYLIKKLFITKTDSHRTSNTLLDQIKPLGTKEQQNNKIKNQKTYFLKKKQGSTPVIESEEENENISDYDEQDNMNSRRNIQMAVSAKGNGATNHYNWSNSQFYKDQNLKNQASASYGSFNDQEDFMMKKIMSYEQQYYNVDVDVRIGINNLEFSVLQPKANLIDPQPSLCKMLIQQNSLTLYKGQNESGFNAFGIQFQTLNKFEMYYLFFKHLKRATDLYTSHPVFIQSNADHFDKLRQVFRDNYRPALTAAKNLNMQDDDNRDTIKGIIQANTGGSQNPSIFFQQKSSQPPQNMIFNADRVREQEDLFNKGKTTTKGKKSSHYDAIFNNLDDGKSSQSQTPKLSFKNLNLNDQQRDEYYHINRKNHSQEREHANHQQDQNQQPARLDNGDDSGLQLQVFSTDENENEEEKDINSFPIGEINGSNDTPVNFTSKKSNSKNQSSKSFLAQMKIKQQEGQQSLNNEVQKQNTIKKKQSITKIPVAPAVIQDQGKTAKATHSKQQIEFNKQVSQVKNMMQRGKSQQQHEEDKNQNQESQKQQQNKEINNKFQSNNDSSKSKRLMEQRSIGSSCEESLIQERENDDVFTGVITKQMNTQALKKTKSNNHEEGNMIMSQVSASDNSSQLPPFDLPFFDLARKDSVPVIFKQPAPSSADISISGSNGLQPTIDITYEPGKYVGVLVALDVICFSMIIFLAISANRAYRFMTSKDRILLCHFVFLELSLFCKTLSLLFGALYYSSENQQEQSWVQFYIFVENLGFVLFYIACSLNLYKCVGISDRTNNDSNRLKYRGGPRCQSNIKFGIVIVFLSLVLISVRFIYQEIFQDYFQNLKYQALINNSWDYPIYEFCAVFFFELTPILAQIILIWTAVRKNWHELEVNPKESPHKSILRLNRSGKLTRSQIFITGDDESLYSSNEEALIRQEETQQNMGMISQRDHFMSTDFAFNQQQQIFLVDGSNKFKLSQMKKELNSQDENVSQSEFNSLDNASSSQHS